MATKKKETLHKKDKVSNSKNKADIAARRQNIIQAVGEYMRLGYSRHKACILAGVSPTTVQEMINADGSLKVLLDAKSMEVGEIARRNWVRQVKQEAIDPELGYAASRDWLTNVERDDFSTKQNVEHGGGVKIVEIALDHGDDDEE